MSGIGEKPKLPSAVPTVTGDIAPVVQADFPTNIVENSMRPSAPNPSTERLDPNSVDQVFHQLQQLPVAQPLASPAGDVVATPFQTAPHPEIGLAPQIATSAPPVVAVYEDEPGWLDDFAFFYAVPSWMVSFIFHLLLILLLALLTYQVGGGKKIELVLAEQSIEDDLQVAVDLMPLDVEEVDLEDAASQESLDQELEALTELAPELANAELSDATDPMDAIDSLRGANNGLTPGDGRGASFFGMGADGSAFVFVVDCSGSMGDENRWYAARQELKTAIADLTEDQRFYVFLYNDTSFSYTRRTPQLIKATAENKAKIFDWLDRQRPDGDTKPWRAMRSSLRLQPNAIFLLSDGELKDDTVVQLRENNGKIKRRGKVLDKVPVHTISLGSGYGQETMRAIAEQNDGSFTHVLTW